MKKHQKHAKLERPNGGQFHKMELGFLGAPCGTIQKLCAEVATHLSDKWNLSYVDADHGDGEELETPYQSIFTDKISFHRLDSKSSIIENSRFLFNNQDAVLVNGNHFKTDRQVLIINEKKKDSLSRKMDRVGQVEMIILDGVNEVFDFVKKFEDVPIFKIEEVDKISNHISKIIESQIAEIIGVVFAGGKSTRMGKDKGEITYHQTNQREHLANLLKPFCKEIYLSGGVNQTFDSGFKTIQDTFIGLGPYGGLLSAFQKFPNNSICTLPIDVPFVDEEMMQQLFKNRNPQKLATCFHNPETKFPEPLITIWEPKAYPVLLNYLSKGYSCPRKVLINTDIEELHPSNPEKLFNANTPQERDFAIKRI